MSDLYSRTVTEYCERVGNHFYSEPINALTNFAFHFGALLLYKKLKAENVTDRYVWILWFLGIAIGTGSLLWHTFANPFTHALDAIPIWLFFLVFLYQLINKLSNSRIITIGTILIFITSQISVSIFFPELLNGSIRHITNVLFFSVITYWFFVKYRYISRALITAFLMYISAIFFRTIDAWSCSYIPFGTHFLWHLLNAVAVYYAITLLVEIKNKQQK